MSKPRIKAEYKIMHLQNLEVQYSSVSQLCQTLCNPMDCSMPGSCVLYYLCSNSSPVSWWYYLTISPSPTLFSFCFQSFPASGSFPMSQLFASGGWSIGKVQFMIFTSIAKRNSITFRVETSHRHTLTKQSKLTPPVTTHPSITNPVKQNSKKGPAAAVSLLQMQSLHAIMTK